jgi:hypothetical protein
LERVPVAMRMAAQMEAAPAGHGRDLERRCPALLHRN